MKEHLKKAIKLKNLLNLHLLRSYLHDISHSKNLNNTSQCQSREPTILKKAKN